LAVGFGIAPASANWPQWGQNPQHQGFVSDVGQAINTQLADNTYDPFTAAEQATQDGDLLVHYQVPLVHANSDIFMEVKTGRYILCSPPDSGIPPPGETACGTDSWNTQIWNQRRYHWVGADLVPMWTFESGWKPVPSQGVIEWEPVYHAAMANGFIYDPNFGGTISRLNFGDGMELARINPFPTIDPNTFVASPVSADAQGNIYYNVLQLKTDTGNAWLTNDVVGAWLVKVDPLDNVTKVSYSDLVPNAPTGNTCFGQFGVSTLPWPPGPVGSPATAAADPTRRPAQGRCGSQRPGVNVTPAIAPDGTIYTVSRAHFNSRYSFLVAVNPDLTPKWAASLRDRHINDGCGVLIQIATEDNPIQRSQCRFGATVGVDPQTNMEPAGRVIDQSSASPVVLPDGNVIYGSYTRYNIARGHLFKFSANGGFLAAYDFGWDETPAVRSHDGTFSIVVKDNHYDEEAGFYCSTATPVSQGGAPTVRNIVCDWTGIPAGPFFITQLSANLVAEWKFKSTQTASCSRDGTGAITCVEDGLHPNGFEWCINAPAIDGNGVSYVNSEDGFLYSLGPNNSGIFTTPHQRHFLKLAIGAAYTPLSIGQDGIIYTQNDGHLFAIGAQPKGNGRAASPVPQSHGQQRFTSRDSSDPTDF